MILVAGGTGLLGSRVVKLLTDAGEQVRVVTRDRRLLVATLAIQALFVLHQISPLFAPVQ